MDTNGQSREGGGGFRRVLLVVLLLCMIVGAVLCLTGVIPIGEWVEALAEYPILVGAVLLVLYAVKGVSGFILHDVLLLAAAMIYSFPVAMVLSYAGTVLCVSIPYFIGRLNKSEKIWAKIEANRTLRRFLGEDRQGLVPLCILLRSLGLQSELIGLFFGVMGMPYPVFLLVSLLSMTPLMLCILILGSTLSLTSPWFWVTLGISLSMAVTAHLIDRFRRRKQAL